MRSHSFDRANSIKTEFSDAYNQKSPELYFNEMSKLEYQIPDQAKTLINFIIEENKIRTKKQKITILDVGCSYGVLPALIKHNLDLVTLYKRYSVQSGRDTATRQESSEEAVLSGDAHWFGHLPARSDVAFFGLDISRSAIEYALHTHLLVDGISENLELEATKDLARLPRDIDLIVSTGCVGYVTEATFKKILSHLEEPQPWIASFVLQIFDYQPIADCVAHYGYRSQQLRHRTFRQRRFKNVQEQTSHGADPARQRCAGSLSQRCS